jgi:hypothetical protein
VTVPGVAAGASLAKQHLGQMPHMNDNEKTKPMAMKRSPKRKVPALVSLSLVHAFRLLDASTGHVADIAHEVIYRLKEGKAEIAPNGCFHRS